MSQGSTLPNCPQCNHHDTQFIPASLVTIIDLEDIEYFYKSPHFSYLITEGPNNEYRHVAAHFFKCHQLLPDALDDLPDAYDLKDWKDPGSSIEGMGTLFCQACGHYEKHILGEQHRLS
ncbi:MAG: hypothetical protein HRU09_11710 [Oligoflexales bacterium]|nr:hypothetical protein [Oligoflexales bacterium]